MNFRFGFTLTVLLAGLLLLAACGAVPSTAPSPLPTSQPNRRKPPSIIGATQPAAPALTPQPIMPTPTGLARASTSSDISTQAGEPLVVGSSLDNPPYSTYDDQFHPAGFDVALITEIGRRLGRPVEVNDFTFEGLLDALQLKQVDAAIAAIDVTPTRRRRSILRRLTSWGRTVFWRPRRRRSHLSRPLGILLTSGLAFSAARSTKAG